jgi:hypothetical protein
VKPDRLLAEGSLRAVRPISPQCSIAACSVASWYYGNCDSDAMGPDTEEIILSHLCKRPGLAQMILHFQSMDLNIASGVANSESFKMLVWPDDTTDCLYWTRDSHVVLVLMRLPRDVVFP